MHDISVAINVHFSSCDSKLGVRPGSHRCTVVIADDAATTARFACPIDGCEKSYTSIQGLANHARNHQRQDAVNAATVPMPRPATRQQRRVNPEPAPRRGGDARVPVHQVADAGDRNNNGQQEPRKPGHDDPDTRGSDAARAPRTPASTSSDTGSPSLQLPTSTTAATVTHPHVRPPTSIRRSPRPSTVTPQPTIALPAERGGSPKLSHDNTSVRTASTQEGLPQSCDVETGAGSVAESDDGDGCDGYSRPEHEEGIILTPDDTTPIHDFLAQLHALVRAPATEYPLATVRGHYGRGDVRCRRHGQDPNSARV
ncbi:unnamed protein product [Macrosiphum euphorbiae]|uniref:C2H2-type domain-containing protein n=1 Tax=Macrosiphum euphorbiae TaxID=13131 RepID=A0AAV0W9S2_9HEMI|nr:unnamed protein product [Macrosiphum euphorbiae]